MFYVYPADGAVFVFDGINGLDRFQYVFNGIVDGILSLLPGQKTLVALILKTITSARFPPGSAFCGDVLVDGMVGTVKYSRLRNSWKGTKGANITIRLP